MRYIQLFENWMKTTVGVFPRPDGTQSWQKSKGKITTDTQKLLDLMEPNFHDVAIFSWHPNIKMAQYTDNPKNFWADTNGKKTNRNSVHWIYDSIIVMRREDKPKETRTFGDSEIIEKIFKQFPMMSGGSGSGDTQNGRNVTQRQISFLVGSVGTFEEADKIRTETFTDGAYTYRDGEWLYIPVADFDPSKKIVEERTAHLNLAATMFKLWPEVEKAEMAPAFLLPNGKFYNKLQPQLVITMKDGGTRKLRIEDISYKRENDYNYTIYLEPGPGQPNLGKNGRIGRVECDGIDDVIMKIQIFPENVASRIAKDPDNYKEILHDFRGHIAGHKFGF